MIGNNLGPPPYLTPFLNGQGNLGENWSRWVNSLYTSIITTNYASSYFAATASWSITSATFGDPVNSTSDSLTSIGSNGITLTPAGSSKLGVTFSPSSNLAIYYVSANISLTSGAAWVAGKLWDGTTLIAYGNAKPLLLSGFYAPGTTDPVTLTVQLAAASGSVTAEDQSGLTTPATFSILQIK